MRLRNASSSNVPAKRNQEPRYLIMREGESEKGGRVLGGTPWDGLLEPEAEGQRPVD